MHICKQKISTIMVELIPIPNSSLIKPKACKADFVECFTVSFTSTNSLKLNNTVYSCFNVFTKGWVDLLFKLRHYLVIPLKLKTPPDTRHKMKSNAEIVKGGKVAFFDVKDVNANEVLMYADDSHLNAYFAISLIQNGNHKIINASTTVNLKNMVGKCYFAVVKPFHKLIMKNMLRKVVQQYTQI